MVIRYSYYLFFFQSRTYKGQWFLSSVQSLSPVRLFATPWIAAHQASLSITNSQSPPKPMSIESVMPSNHLILVVPFSSCPQSLPASGSFPMSHLFAWGGQSIGVSDSASVLPMNTQDWTPLGWTGWISFAVQVILKSLLQHHSSKASILLYPHTYLRMNWYPSVKLRLSNSGILP